MNRHVWDVYPLSLRNALPTILVPCRAHDEDVSLSLQPLINQIYIDGGHDDIDYTRPLVNPLSDDDTEWAKELAK